MELHMVLLIAVTLIPMIIAAFAAELIKSVIALLVGSVGLTLVLFNLNAPIAGIFELSVGAGLIAVLFILSVSLTRPLAKEESAERKRQHYRRFYVLPIIILFLGLILYLNKDFWINAFPFTGAQESASFGEVLWGRRGLDLIGQIGIILVGVFGVIVLFRRGKMNE